MYDKFESWMDGILDRGLPRGAKAIGFNVYEEQDLHWSMQLIATSTFEEDEDWMCDEVFTTGENLFSWQENANWERILEAAIRLVQAYLSKGKYAGLLKDYAGIGVGFVDGDVEIVYRK